MYVLRLFSDCETPITAFLKLRGEFDYAFLLESAEYGVNLGRYSFLGFGKKGEFILDADKRLFIDGKEEEYKEQPLMKIPAWLSKHHRDIYSGRNLPPFRGGAVGFIGYDYVEFIERKLNIGGADFPYAMFVIPEHIIAFDHLKNQIFVMSESPEDIAKMLSSRNIPFFQEKEVITTEPISNFSEHKFINIVKKAKDYIREGEIFQVVLSQRFSFKTFLDKFQIYRALRTINPSPYMFYIEYPPYVIFGSSPEMMTKAINGKVYVKPIAGTRKRGISEEEDLALEKELLSDEKERAEHLMLVDLGRNDVGRVSKLGSVSVPFFMKVEKYSHVLHLVSEVVGEIREDKNSIDAILATFPAGTVTGAPKVRAMEIIKELEEIPRGPYGGAVCYISIEDENHFLNLDSGILIRTFFFNKNNGFIQAGAGIVYDSIPEYEYKETLNKLNALFRALELANSRKLLG
jgi:anthranilate synthase component 1